MKHTHHRMHGHSLAAFAASDFSQREQAVLRVLRESGRAMTDRAVMVALGYADPNTVRPRITHLLEVGAIAEAGDTECPLTHKTVRTVRIAVPVQESIV